MAGGERHTERQRVRSHLGGVLCASLFRTQPFVPDTRRYREATG